MKPIRIFRHVTCEGPGLLEDVLRERGLAQELIAIDQNMSPETDLDRVSALVFMGGPMSVNDDLDWIRRELDLIRAADRRGMPILGHCLGGQLIAKALGGVVGPNPVKEIGWLPVRQTPGPAAQDWLAGIADEFTAYHWHGETFSLPQGFQRLLSSAHCTNQAMVRGKTLALQCHVEMKADMVREWAHRYAHELEPGSPTIQSEAEQTRDLEARIVESSRAAIRIYDRWLRGIMV